MVSSEGSSRAEEARAEAPRSTPSNDFVFRATLPSVLEARLPDLRLPSARASMTPTALSKDEKIVIIVAACVVGAILLFATFQIGAHNHPF